MEVYVIRHTRVAVGKDTCYGQTDVPLSETFIQEAEQYRKLLPTDFDIVYCSPSQRCKALATELKFQNVVFDNNLMEMNFGDWENKKWNDIHQEDLHRWMADFVYVRAPNGESLVQLFDRVKAFFDNLRKKNHSKVLVITHAGVIRCLWSYLLEIPLKNIFKIPIDYNEIFVCKLAEDTMADTIIRTK